VALKANGPTPASRVIFVPESAFMDPYILLKKTNAVVLSEFKVRDFE
jgi:hypothetical protein